MNSNLNSTWNIKLDLSPEAITSSRMYFPVVLFDEAHSQSWSINPDMAKKMNPANPSDSCLSRASQRLQADGFTVIAKETGELNREALTGVDTLVIAHPSEARWERTTGTGSPIYSESEVDAIVEFVANGGGLIVLAEHEQDKYGNNINTILARFGLNVLNNTVVDPPNSFRGVSAWIQPIASLTSSALLARVKNTIMYRCGTIQIMSTSVKATEILVSSHTATPARAPLLVSAHHGAGRIILSADSDLFGDDSIDDGDHEQLWSNLVTWVSLGRVSNKPSGQYSLPSSWSTLKAATEELRKLQDVTGAILNNTEEASRLIDIMNVSIEELSILLPHQSEYFCASTSDLNTWRENGYGIPDFLNSLLLFRPDLQRFDGVEHIALFNMYTQNGNAGRNMEAVWIRTVWPDWINAVEGSGYINKAFIPIEFVDFTPGYDTNSATLFPETVSVRDTPTFHWGGIFCDREAARFRLVASSATSLLKLQLPPDAELLIKSELLSKETFVLWDLVHDRTHSHGDLPFDPFMIKQRMPFWMYALEELRCDLNAYVESSNIQEAGIPQARLVRYAIIFDRIFRFSVSGDRVRNYDGLAGQILFAHLHKNSVLRWTDNTLNIDWLRLDNSVYELWEEVNELYRDGIDKSRIGYWRSAYELVAKLVTPNPSSLWSNNIDLGQAPKELVNAVLPDEFPLNVFFEALRSKLATVIADTRGVR